MALTFLLLAPTTSAEARQARSAKVVREFRQTHVCPSTGLKIGPCPGWEADHWLPLCAGGLDRPWQLHWLSIAEHKAKTKLDLVQCRLLRRPKG